MGLDREGDFIEALYDAALGQRSWKDIGQQLVGHMGGKTTMLSVRDPRSGAVDLVETQGMSPSDVQDYGQYFGQHDLWALGASQKRMFNRISTSPELVDDRVLKRSIIYNEYLLPKVNVVHIAGAAIPLEGGLLGTFAVHRTPDNRDFNAGEVRRLQRLVPHVQRALEIRQRLRQAEQLNRSIYSVLDRLNLGVILIGATGRLLHVNMAADAILRAGDGLVRSLDGLRAARKDDDKRLQQMLSALRDGRAQARSAGGHLRLHRPSGRQAYALMLAPAGPSVGLGGKDAPAVLIFVSDPERKIVSDAAVLMDLFGFTPAEARLVLALLSGVALPEFARSAGVSYNTVRTLLSRAMARTGSRSQLGLVLLIAGSIGTTMAPPGGPGTP